LRTVAGKHDPDARIVPHMLTSSTDAVFYRSLGLSVYGFEPYRITWEDYNRCHGNDERFPIENLEFGLAFHRDFLVELCGKDSR
jgi:acetylornithine deacetylase/succinyl-diaminopimelate desuccinylase-like protein